MVDKDEVIMGGGAISAIMSLIVSLVAARHFLSNFESLPDLKSIDSIYALIEYIFMLSDPEIMSAVVVIFLLLSISASVAYKILQFFSWIVFSAPRKNSRNNVNILVPTDNGDVIIDLNAPNFVSEKLRDVERSIER